jgi:biopolymer transport protein ExbB/TolQ
VLDFLRGRGSAAELDDQLRALADNDALAVENGGSLVRFITWAIPILGFLGTVLGITQAISGATPERLEHSLSTVTDGLAEAFDCTALALALTMLTMFLSFLVDRAEQSMLEAVDEYADRHLAHRFERPNPNAVMDPEAFRSNLQAVLAANEQLVQRQTVLWAQTMQELHGRFATSEKAQQDRFVAALDKALAQTLESHQKRLGLLEKQSLEQAAGLLKQMSELALAVRETGTEQREALRVLSDRVVAQAKVLATLQENEKTLRGLQEALNQNLHALAGVGTFDQALHSLTAAIHLLTARAGSLSGAGGPPRVAA